MGRDLKCFTAALALGLLLWTGRARATGLEVTPVRVDLSRRASNAIVSLKNGGDEATRYQVSVLSWQQDAAGDMQLAPTKDLAFFPPLLTLKPGEQRNLRVGATPERFGPLEKTYRLIVEELPKPLPERQSATPQVRVLTRVSIPIFLEPAKVVEQAEVDNLAVAAGAVRFRFVNLGSVHVRPTQVAVTALGAPGEELAGKRWDGWYVLPAGERSYEWRLPARPTCGKIRSIAVEVALEKGAVRSSLPTPGGACAQ